MNKVRVLLGLEKPFWEIVATHWRVSVGLRRCGYEVMEVNFWHVMLPLLIDRNPYTAFISSKILWLNDPSNGDRASIYSLCRTFPQNTYIIWSHSDWEIVNSPLNLRVWSGSEDRMIEDLINLLEKEVRYD